LLRLAAAAEAPSEHPLARAVVAAAQEEGLALPEAREFSAVAGGGVTARVEDRAILVGTPRLLAERGVQLAPAVTALQAHESQARTVALVAVDGAVAGVLAIADEVKPDAAAAIAELKRRRIAPVLVTGDNARTAEALAQAVGIAEVHAQVLPHEKAGIVRRLQAGGARVAMVGDGINDAPALVQADVGIAIGAGTDIAIESADVVLVGKRLAAVPEAIAIGAMSYRKTLQNLWLAFSFNGIGVPVAASGVLHPAWAMAAMAASVTAVLANSFGARLLKRTPAPVAERIAAPGPDRPGTPEESLALSVPGIHCEGCVATIQAGLMLEEGVAAVEGDAQRRTVRVRYRPGATSPQRIEAALAQLGYPVAKNGARAKP
jgi:P-type E1-E2 ATPase